MNENNPVESLNEIKSMMQRSSKFTSISGWSGVWVGLVGIISAVIAYFFLLNNEVEYYENRYETLSFDITFLALAVTFIIACVGGFYFMFRKSQKDGNKFINPVTKRILRKFIFVLTIGGILGIIFILKLELVNIVPTTLLFYGLALYTVERDTIIEIKYLALCEIILGLLAFYFIYNGLIFWFVGFGLLHLIFGIWMVRKYDNKA